MAIELIHRTPRCSGSGRASLISGYLSEADQRAVSGWITLNEAAIVEYWDGVIDTAELLGRLKRV
jgi:hypothetical protein